MNLQKLLQHNFKELEGYLNHAITDLNYTDIDANNVRRMMWDRCKNLFGNTITIQNSSTKELLLTFGKVCIIFGIGTKNTGRTVEVSRLRKKDVKQPGKFKFKSMSVSFNEPYFTEELNNDYIVNVDEHKYMMPTYYVWFKNYTDTTIGDLLTRKVFEKELHLQNENFNIENSLVLLMAQPWIKKAYFDPNFTQVQWDIILENVRNANKELLKTCVDNFYEVF